MLPATAAAIIDPLSDVLLAPGSTGLGILVRNERSPYEGAGMRRDLVPLYLYEGKRVFLHASRVGFKLRDGPDDRLDVFLDYRFEGFPSVRVPPSLAGMETRGPTTDAGISYRHRGALGIFEATYLRDALSITNGSELRLGYRYDWRGDRWTLRPGLTLMLRSANLNNYYYGVRAEEAASGRPAYEPGAGANVWAGFYGSYALTQRWKLVGGAGTTIFDDKVRNSPIVKNSNQPAAFVGAAYDFGEPARQWGGENPPLYVKLLYGKSAAPDCHLIRIMTLRCTSTDSDDNTRISALELGRPLVEELNGWPLDFVGYVGLLHHDENGLQGDAWQLNAYIKAFYYGFPWSGRVKTRIGFGTGISVADRVPFVEVRDQAQRGRNTSKLLNYLDPSVDVSLGDVLGVRSLKHTYIGLGVSHRSGIFGTSRLLGNVNGGSNYLYTYIESRL